MKFLVQDGSIHCIREYGEQTRDHENVVVSFDEDLSSIAPHVAADPTRRRRTMSHWMSRKF